MKKILFTAFLIFFVTGISSAQKLLPIKPSVEVIIKGAFGTPLSDDAFKNGYKSFPGGQLEVVANITSSFGVYGNFSADFLSAKDQSLIGQTVKQDNTYMLSGNVGPRYYFNIPGNILFRFFADAGLGIYATRLGDKTVTTLGNPVTTETSIYNAYTQMGFNVGTGINLALGPIGTANLTLKYHNLLSKSGITVVNTKTSNSGTVTAGTPEDIPSKSYFSVAVGLGFKIGL